MNIIIIICNNLKQDNHEEYTSESLYHRYLSIFADLTERQREILRAIAAEKVAVNVTSGEFVRRYHLKSPSSVQSALKRLSGKGIVGKILDGYVINDRLFRFWIKRNPI